MAFVMGTVKLVKSDGAPGLLLRNADLFAPEPVGIVDILAVHGRIVAIGKGLPRPRAFPVEEVDLEGRIVAPGLVDLHVHLIGGGGEGGPASRVPPLSPEVLIRGGVTTAVGLLGTDGITRSPEDLLATARGLVARGLSAYIYTGSYALPSVTLTGSVARDLVLIPEVLGAKVAISDHRSSQPGPRELLVLAAEARLGGMLAGKRGIVHVHVGGGKGGLEPLFRAVEDGDIPIAQFHPTHVGRSGELLSQAAEWARRGGSFDLTAPPADSLPSLERALAEIEAAGVDWGRITMSSDGGGSRPRFDRNGNLVAYEYFGVETLWEAVRYLHAKGGYPLERLLPLVTENPARTLGIPEKGKLEVGYDADLLVLGDELAIEGVYSHGVRLL
ncbi:beta-aspartyl-peptidase [Candidatus Bipolaricaulota sp. J31]